MNTTSAVASTIAPPASQPSARTRQSTARARRSEMICATTSMTMTMPNAASCARISIASPSSAPSAIHRRHSQRPSVSAHTARKPPHAAASSAWP